MLTLAPPPAIQIIQLVIKGLSPQTSNGHGPVLLWNGTKLNFYKNEMKEKKQIHRKYKLTFFIIRFIMTYFSFEML